MRFQVDEHREELKGKIDVIALAMIDRIKTCGEEYLKSFKKKSLFEDSSFDGKQSLENKLKELEETFRHPNLLSTTIQEMQREQEEYIYAIQFKINEINQVKDDLRETNGFKPNLSLFDQETSLFGVIKLSGYTNKKSSLKSQILTGINVLLL
jgi:chlorite dismutase